MFTKDEEGYEVIPQEDLTWAEHYVWAHLAWFTDWLGWCTLCEYFAEKAFGRWWRERRNTEWM